MYLPFFVKKWPTPLKIFPINYGYFIYYKYCVICLLFIVENLKEYLVPANDSSTLFKIKSKSLKTSNIINLKCYNGIKYNRIFLILCLIEHLKDIVSTLQVLYSLQSKRIIIVMLKQARIR